MFVKRRRAFKSSEQGPRGRRAKIRPMSRTTAARIATATYKEFVGQNLIDARKSLGWKQAKLARELGIATNKLNQWEKGLYYPDPWLIKKFCEDYGFTMDWFYRRIRAGVSAERVDGLKRVAEEV